MTVDIRTEFYHQYSKQCLLELVNRLKTKQFPDQIESNCFASCIFEINAWQMDNKRISDIKLQCNKCQNHIISYQYIVQILKNCSLCCIIYINCLALNDLHVPTSDGYLVMMECFG